MLARPNSLYVSCWMRTFLLKKKLFLAISWRSWRYSFVLMFSMAVNRMLRESILNSTGKIFDT